VITLAVYWATRNLGKTYKVEATIYTGIISGYGIEGQGTMDWAATNNAIDNLINIMKAESTLKRVSFRLYARCMINGNMEQDNHYVFASNFRYIYNHTKNSPDGRALLMLIDKNSEDETVKNMEKYEKPTADNYIYGLFYYTHPFFSHGALQRISVRREGNSDLLQVEYASSDPGIAYNTVDILSKEFVEEYRNIRYGETDKVIEYFRQELARLGTELRLEEDSLTAYNVEKRIVNYTDETKELASINKEYQLREQDILLEYNSARAQLEELERQLDINMKALSSNREFVSLLNEVASLTSKITELETFSSTNIGDEAATDLQYYKDQLAKAEKKFSEVSDAYLEHNYSKEGLIRTDVVTQWLEQLLLFEKAKAQLNVIQTAIQQLNDRYVFYAPVGSTIRRKERAIDFTERSYLGTMDSYNAALMRKKNLEMTSATIKVLNPPAFPIGPEPTGRRQIVMVACAAAFFFILGFFLLIELLDHTLRDRLRAERITGGKVLGAFPGRPGVKYRNYAQEYYDISCKYLSSVVMGFFTERKGNEPYIVNFISTESGDGKTFLSMNLEEYWKNMGLRVRRISWDSDFDTNDKRYLLAESIQEVFNIKGEDIVIVEHPNLNGNTVPNKLLDEANLNLMIARADRSWKDSDRLIYKKLTTQVTAPIAFYLNNTSVEVAENFTGMLPPYTYLRKLSYRLSKLGLTEQSVKEDIYVAPEQA
jgi:uncharacterized protein involved in exopolysaccharide biosynthesis